MNRFVWCLATCLTLGPLFASAQSTDFTFRRVKPPNGDGPRITVQVAPPAPKAPPGASAVEVGTDDSGAKINGGPPAQSNLAWYWQIMNPDLDAASAGRIFAAETALTQAPAGAAAVKAPRLQFMQDIAAAYGRTIMLETIGKDVSPAFILAVISVESAGKADALSSAGALGLMQLMPATADRFGVTDRKDPAQSIKGGVAYLSLLLDLFDNDPLLALAGYNAGENAVARNDGVPPFAETRDYVPKVIAAWTIAKGLCVTPPELVTDGCVFRISQ